MLIRFLVESFYSKRDIYGNTYSYSRVTSTATGKSVLVDYAPNVSHSLSAAGLDWQTMRESESVLPIREFNRVRKIHEKNEGGSLHGAAFNADVIRGLEATD